MLPDIYKIKTHKFPFHHSSRTWEIFKKNPIQLDNNVDVYFN